MRGTNRRPKLGQHRKGLVVRRAHQACKMSYPGQKKKSAESLQSKSHLKKGQVSSENDFRERIKHFLQWICPSKGKRLEEPLQRCRPAADTAQSHRTVKSHLITDSKAVEAQALMTVDGQILEKTVLHCGPHASELNWYKVELQAPLGPPYCYHGFLSYPGQRRMMRQTAHQQQASPTGHRSPTGGQAQGQHMALPTQGASPCPGRACQHRSSGSCCRPFPPLSKALSSSEIPSSRSEHACHSFPSKKSLFQEKNVYHADKNMFSSY